MPKRFNAEGEWDIHRVCAFTGLTARQVSARVRAGSFPKPVRVTRVGKVSLWDAQTIANRWGPGDPVT